MKTFMLIIGLLTLLFVISCAPQVKPACTKPYILVNGSCCLDQNANIICDKDEKPVEPSTPQVPLSVCGDGICDKNETCTSCAADCGECKRALGESCTSFKQCTTNFCVHNICRETATFCGDGFCDPEEYCSDDCGKWKKEYEFSVAKVSSNVCVGSSDNFDCKIQNIDSPEFFIEYDNTGSKTVHNITSKVICTKLSLTLIPMYNLTKTTMYFQDVVNGLLEPLETYSEFGKSVAYLGPTGSVKLNVVTDLPEILNKNKCSIIKTDEAKVTCTVTSRVNENIERTTTILMNVLVDKAQPVPGCK